MNILGLTARLGKDPELNHTKGGMSICTLRVAFEQGKDAPAGWVDVVCMDKTADAVTQYCRKGDEVGISGRLSYRTWESDGRQRSTLEVVANRVDFLRKKGEGGGGSGQEPQAAAQSGQGNEDPFDDDNPRAAAG